MESLEKRAGTFKFLFVPFLLVARRIKAIYVTMKVPNCFPSLLSFKKGKAIITDKENGTKLSSNTFLSIR